MRSKEFIAIATTFTISLITQGVCLAKPTPQEKAAFIAAQKRDKAAFDLSILRITDPRAAASTEFYAKAKEERIAFIRSLSGITGAEKTEKLAEYNRNALAKKTAFEKKLTTIEGPKNVKLDEIIKKRRDFERSERQKAIAFYAE